MRRSDPIPLFVRCHTLTPCNCELLNMPPPHGPLSLWSSGISPAIPKLLKIRTMPNPDKRAQTAVTVTKIVTEFFLDI
jgi:hypothetical protein